MTKPQTTAKDFLFIGLSGLLLLALGLGALYYLSSIGNMTALEPYESDIPAEGQWLHIDAIETYWITNAKEEVIPVATITIDSNHNSDGTLRVLFKSNIGDANEVSKYVGDSNTLAITGGKFPNGSNTITIQCTKGLENMADYLGYKSQPFMRWVVELREAAPNANRATDFSELTHAPLNPVMLEVAQQ
ncbi:hypothetical protein [Rubritalea marina]|uniref:hypothetical protein n=1 Tax=Rubritalea marina TaxID=361055 RepID=UPI0003666CBA|nr:hypothetical protein [Rubritalea marina]